MISSTLKHQMEQAYIEGKYDRALELSQKLDMQIVKVMKKSHHCNNRKNYWSKGNKYNNI